MDALPRDAANLSHVDLDLTTRDFERWRAHFPVIKSGGHWVGNSLESDFEGRVTRRVVGDVSVNLISVRSHPHAIERADQQVREVPSAYVLAAVQLAGTSRLSTPRGEATLRAGDHVINSWGMPSRWQFIGDFTLFVARFSEQQLRFALDTPGAPIGEVLPGRSGAGTVLVPFVRALARNLDVLRSRAGVRMTHSLVDIFGASLLGATAPPSPRGLDDVFERATSYLDVHLAIAGTGLDAVAEELHVSRRQVQAAFTARGTTVTAWLRERRLDRVRADLEDVALAHRTIARIARERGFPNPAYFSRLFRDSTGCTPREWRARHLGGAAAASALSQRRE